MKLPFIAQTIDDMVTPQKALKISGLDYMMGILNGEFPVAPISQIMDYKLIDVAYGRVIFRGSPSFSALNPMVSVHGGWY